ncbi:hypothetical protein JMA_14140 [Jeotgalibacillus malaysiensis]|uniref:Competence protein CoiA n=1 Tax=Jeotgalibacillus malaysiensis TaxID=1508404 RepID=A0A0B5AKW9_9BACL|nr:competence protein CoiA family protein [Jeotgalibacillus malaysiensis]AJD90731.1 hypothetical protein JMA_14140 [Jeotgalibacillus malaysiensis]
MLIAQTPQGSPVSLYLARHNSPLVSSLRTQSLICPSCKSTVIVKAGQKVIPHFAHKSKAACRGFSENESAFHLLAKTSLNRWFLNQSLQTELEKNYADINRRADISVQIQQTDFAVEVQCSPISAELLQLRSADYRKVGAVPFWLLPSEFIQKSSMIKLSAFYQQFIRYSPAARQYYLLTYSPHEHTFTIYHHLIPLSKSLFLTSFNEYHQDTLYFPSFPIRPFSMSDSLYNVHIKMNEKWLVNVLRYRRSVKDPLLRKLYEANLSLYKTPPWVGLLLRSNIFFLSSPMEWQIHLYISMQRGRTFAKHQLIQELQQLIRRKVIHQRVLLDPPADYMFEQTVDELLNVLEKCDLILPVQSGYMLKKSGEAIGVKEETGLHSIREFHNRMKAQIIQEYNRR